MQKQLFRPVVQLISDHPSMVQLSKNNKSVIWTQIDNNHTIKNNNKSELRYSKSILSLNSSLSDDIDTHSINSTVSNNSDSQTTSDALKELLLQQEDTIEHLYNDNRSMNNICLSLLEHMYNEQKQNLAFFNKINQWIDYFDLNKKNKVNNTHYKDAQVQTINDDKDVYKQNITDYQDIQTQTINSYQDFQIHTKQYNQQDNDENMDINLFNNQNQDLKFTQGNCVNTLSKQSLNSFLMNNTLNSDSENEDNYSLTNISPRSLSCIEQFIDDRLTPTQEAKLNYHNIENIIPNMIIDDKQIISPTDQANNQYLYSDSCFTSNSSYTSEQDNNRLVNNSVLTNNNILINTYQNLHNKQEEAELSHDSCFISNSSCTSEQDNHNTVLTNKNILLNISQNLNTMQEAAELSHKAYSDEQNKLIIAIKNNQKISEHAINDINNRLANLYQLTENIFSSIQSQYQQLQNIYETLDNTKVGYDHSMEIVDYYQNPIDVTNNNNRLTQIKIILNKP